MQHISRCQGGGRLQWAHARVDLLPAAKPPFLISATLLDWVALIDRLEASDRDSLRAHFLALDNDDRRLRFGAVSDRHISSYVDSIDFDLSHVYGCAEVGRIGSALAI